MQEDLISGFHAVLSALTTNPGTITTIWIDENRFDKRVQSVLDATKSRHIKLQRVPRAQLDKLTGDNRHQGVIARVQQVPLRSEEALPGLLENIDGTPFLLVLDGIQDPHNLGACLRSAAAAGIQAVILPRDRASPITTTVRRAASGAVDTLPIFQVSNLARVLKLLQVHGIWLVGAAGDSETTIYEVDLTGPIALILGGEGKGLRRLTREHCDTLATIPMAAAVESLNVSVAAGVCLFEAVRQRRLS